MTDTNLVALLHLLLAGYWLGADLAVYLIASAVADARHPVAVRVFAARFMLLVDMVPRTCLLLVLATGAHLAIRYFAPAHQHWIVPLWILTLAWLALLWWLYRRQHGEKSSPRRLALLDGILRLALILALSSYALVALSRALIWLALKLALFALIVLLGLIIRWQLMRFAPLFQASLQEPANESAHLALRQLIAEVKIPVWGIWLSVLAAALLGHLKPVF